MVITLAIALIISSLLNLYLVNRKRGYTAEELIKIHNSLLADYENEKQNQD